MITQRSGSSGIKHIWLLLCKPEVPVKKSRPMSDIKLFYDKNFATSGWFLIQRKYIIFENLKTFQAINHINLHFFSEEVVEHGGSLC